MHHCRVAKHPKISEIIQIIVLLFELYILKHIIFILKPIICCFSKNLSHSYYTLLYGYYTHYTYYFIYSSITTVTSYPKIICIIAMICITWKISEIICYNVSIFGREDTNYANYNKLLWQLSQRFCAKNNML